MITCEPVIDRLLEKGVGSVLVIGVHTGREVQRFLDAGVDVTGIDILPRYRNGYHHIRARFEDYELFEKRYDAVVSSHTLEHMEDVGAVLRKLQTVLRPDGWLGLVVPGYPQELFHVGHYTLWTPALLIYNLVAAGWDCRDASYYTSAERKHVGVLVQNRPFTVDPAQKGWDVFDAQQERFPVRFTHGMNAWLPDRWENAN